MASGLKTTRGKPMTTAITIKEFTKLLVDGPDGYEDPPPREPHFDTVLRP